MEYCLFPMYFYNLSQGFGSSSFSHKSIMALDLAGRDTGKDIVFAPFSGTIRKIYTQDANEVWLESDNEVMCADGKKRRLVVLFAHDDDVSNLYVGMHVNQGDPFLNEGRKGNTTGNHCHIEVGLAPFHDSGWFLNSQNHWQINDPIDPRLIFILKDDCTVINDHYLNESYAFPRVSSFIPKEESEKYPVGTRVQTIDYGNADSYGTGNRARKGDIGYVVEIEDKSRPFPYRISFAYQDLNPQNTIGYFNENGITTV